MAEMIDVPKGADGDQVDCIIGPQGRTDKVFVINQVKPDGTFDEHKVVFGCDTKSEAKDAYLANYPKDWKGFGSIVKMKVPKFLEWLKEDHSKPAKDDYDMKICKDCGMAANSDSSACIGCGGSAWVQLTDPVKAFEDNPDSSQIITTEYTDPADGLPIKITLDPSCDDVKFALAYDKKWNTAARHALPKSQFGLPESEGFPADGPEDLVHAASLLHHTPNPGKVKRRLKAIAHKHGWALPESWSDGAAEDMGQFYCDNCKSTFDAHCNDAECPCPNCLLDAKRMKHSAVGNIKPRAAADDIGYDEFFCETDEIQIIMDGLDEGELMKVRHLATIADSMNGNNRIYPRDVVQKSVNKLRSRIRQGNKPYSEYRHPGVGKDGGEDKYFDNPDRRSGRIDNVEDPDHKGRVYITRTILSTPHGHSVASAYKTGTHKGVSNRWKMQGHYAKVGGRQAHVADDLDWHTTDDVDNPAFPQTRNDYHLLTDEMLAEAGLLPAIDDNKAAGSARKGKIMNPKFIEAREKLWKLIRDGASKKKVLQAFDLVKDELKFAEGRGEPLADMSQILHGDSMAIQAYDPSREAPTGTYANETGDPHNPGWAPDMEKMADPIPMEPSEEPIDEPNAKTTEKDSKTRKVATKTVSAADGGLSTDAIYKALGVTADEFKSGMLAIKTAKTVADKATADAVLAEEIRVAIDTVKETVLDGIDPDVQEIIVKFVAKTATDAKSVASLMAAAKDDFMPALSRARLAGGGFDPNTSLQGKTVGNDKKHNSLAVVKEGEPAYMAQVDAILAETDKWANTLNKGNAYGENPDSSLVKSRRAYNREHTIKPILDGMREARYGCKNPQEWIAKMDDVSTADGKAVSDSIERALTDSNTTTLANVFNQPVLLTTLIIQQFQDMQSGSFVQSIGPGLSTGDDPGWTLRGKMNDGRTGAVIRIPVESYTPPTGFGTQYGNIYDAGLLTPENVGIDIGTPNIVWLEFSAAFRRIASDISHDVIKMMGEGPLNYAAISRALFHITWDKARRIDTANLNEIVLTSDEYANVKVTGESPALTYNSVYAASGGVTVNLNTAKYANAAVGTTDAAITYGNAANTGTNGQVPVGAVRLQTNQGKTVTSAGGVNANIFAGTSFGTTMILRPRTKNSLNALGQLAATTYHPVTITAPTAMVEGTYDTFGNIQPTALQQLNNITPTFAVDYENGVVLFANGAVAGASNVVTTTVTVTYYYVTNFVNFVLNNVQALGLLASGQNIQSYMNNFFLTLDQQAAAMASLPRLIKPDIMFSSVVPAADIVSASLFYKFNSPDGTKLYPTEDYYFQHNGILGARINAPWWGGDRRGMMLRGGSTKYAVSDPFTIYGPYPKTDSSGRPIGGNLWYGEELSANFTPTVTGTDGLTILQPPSSSIIFR
jgi:Inorganic Pyrophosphatase